MSPGDNQTAKPVDNPVRPVDNPARKLLDAMPLAFKTSYKSVKKVHPSRVGEAVDNLAGAVWDHDRILAAVLDALDLLTARLDGLHRRIEGGGEL